jgi:hypothetical protein
MFIEVVLARTERELSEVRYADELQWFRSHAAALQFATGYAASIERSQGRKVFVSVCQPDGTWVSLVDIRDGVADATTPPGPGPAR